MDYQILQNYDMCIVQFTNFFAWVLQGLGLVKYCCINLDIANNETGLPVIFINYDV